MLRYLYFFKDDQDFIFFKWTKFYDPLLISIF